MSFGPAPCLLALLRGASLTFAEEHDFSPWTLTVTGAMRPLKAMHGNDSVPPAVHSASLGGRDQCVGLGAEQPVLLWPCFNQNVKGETQTAAREVSGETQNERQVGRRGGRTNRRCFPRFHPVSEGREIAGLDTQLADMALK